MEEGPRQQTEKSSQVSIVAIPVLFVLLWASGFVVPRVFGPYVEPITFIGARNGGAALVLVLIALALRRPWPQQRSEQLGLMWAGALLQGFFTMAVYWSIHRGLPVGIAALAGGLQPALTALFAAWIVSERVSARQWIGIALGFAGLMLVMTPKLGAGQAATSAGLTALALAGVACTSYASIYQKRFEAAGDAVTRTALMYVGALVPTLIVAPLIEDVHVTFRSVFVVGAGARYRSDDGAASPDPKRPSGQGRLAYLSGAASLGRHGLSGLWGNGYAAADRRVRAGGTRCSLGAGSRTGSVGGAGQAGPRMAVGAATTGPMTSTG